MITDSHIWDEEITQEATDTTPGLKTKTCGWCGRVEEEEIPALNPGGEGEHTEHEWGDPMRIKAPTCTEKGVLRYTCTVCGGTKEAPIAKVDHTWTETIVQEPTEAEAGLKKFTCEVCGEEKEEEIPKLEEAKEPEYIFENVEYDGSYITGNLEQIVETPTTESVYTRVTMYLNDGSSVVVVMDVDMDDMDFEIGASDDLVYLKTVVTDTKDCIQAGDWHVLGAYEQEFTYEDDDEANEKEIPKLEATGEPEYIFENVEYDGLYITGKLKQIVETPTAERVYLRMTMHLNDGSYIIVVMNVNTDDLTFKIGVSGDFVSVEMAITNTKKCIQPGDWLVLGTYEQEF